jgi:hypothetical protein
MMTRRAKNSRWMIADSSCAARHPWSLFPYSYVQRNLRASLARDDMVGFASKPADAARPRIESRVWVRLPE